MKTLTLICHCGVRREFCAADVPGILSRIDASGWADHAWIPTQLPRASAPGACPAHVDDPDPRDDGHRYDDLKGW